MPTHSIGRAPKLRHRDRGVPTHSSGGPEITSPKSGGADPVGRGLEIVLTKSGMPAGGLYHTPRSGCPESMRLALDILEGQNFARKNHHRVGPRRARAAELAAVDALDRHGEFVPLRERLKGE